MSAVEPEERLRLLQELARKVPQEQPRFTFNLHWENADRAAGVHVTDDGAFVYFDNAQQEISNLAEAEALLRQIFADEVVSVTGYDREQFQFCRLVPADAITGGIPVRGHHEWVNFVSCDHLLVQTWSSGVLPSPTDDD